MAREAIDAVFNDNNYAEQAAAPAPALTVRSRRTACACFAYGLSRQSVISIAKQSEQNSKAS